MVLRPVVWLGLAYIAGEMLAWGQPAGKPIYIVTFILAAGAAAAGGYRLKRTYGAGRTQKKKFLFKGFFIVLPAFFIGGYFNYSSVFYREISQDQKILSRMEDSGNGSVTLTGRVHTVEEKNSCWYLYVEECRELPVNRILVVILKESFPCLDELSLCGNGVLCSGTVQLFEHPANEGGFDEWMYYHSRGIGARVFAQSLKVSPMEGLGIEKKAAAFRSWIRKNCNVYFEERFAGVAVSMVCADQSLLDGDLKEIYRLSGISHILAISGLHISFVGNASKKLLSCMRIPRRICILIALGIMVLYGWFTGMEPSAMRAVVMTGLSFAAQLSGRTYDPPTGLFIAAFVILLPKPLMVTQPGFLLSFCAAGSLMLCPKTLSLNADGPDKKKQKYVIHIRQLIFKLLCAPVFVTVGMLPALAWCFYEVSLYSIIVNLAVVPLMAFAYPGMLICATVGGLAGPVAVLTARMAEGILIVYEWICRISMNMEGAVWLTGCPGALQLMLAYILMATAAGGYLYAREFSDKFKARFLCVCSVFLTFLGIVLIVFPAKPRELSVTMVNVGQGDCFLIQLPDGHNILVDGGSIDEKNAGKYILIPFLKSRGVGRLDAVIITHLDSDHMSAVVEMMEECHRICDSYGAEPADLGSIAVKRLLLPYHAWQDPQFERLGRLADQMNIPCYAMSAGDRIGSGPLELMFLWPGREKSGEKTENEMDRNSSGLVFNLSYNNFDMLFTGDMGIPQERDIIKNMKLFGIEDCDVLKTAHHGSRESTSGDFLAFVRPKLALISCGKDNAYGHPHEELLSRLGNTVKKIYISARDGETIVYTDGNTLKTVVWTWTGGYNNRQEVLTDNEIQNAQ